jgi:hypothetical protein
MRRISGLVLIAVGVAAVVLAIALPTFVYPRVAKAPENPTDYSVARGTGLTVLLPALVAKGGNGILQNQTVVSTRNVVGQVPPNGSTVPDGQEFYQLAYKAYVEQPNDPQSIPAEDRLLEANVEGASLNATAHSLEVKGQQIESGASTNCCADYLSTVAGQAGAPITHRGLVFKFPFNTKKQSYQFWDSTVKAPYTARYDGTEKLDGLLTYRFVQPIPDVVVGQVEVPGALVSTDQASVMADRVYSTVRTLWIEPRTGAIIKGQEQLNQRLVYLGKEAPIIHGTITYTPQTVANYVKQYKSDARQLAIVSTYGPITLWILGPLLILIGLTVLYVGARRDPDDEWGYDEEDDEENSHPQPV